MAKLGKCLVFYLKYQAEMDRLYWRPRETREEPSIEGLKDKDNVLSMIKRVGDAACREAADFVFRLRDVWDQLRERIGKAVSQRNLDPGKQLEPENRWNPASNAFGRCA